MIDKSKWKKVKFGDVVLNLNRTIKHVPNKVFDRIIGLEHIDGENIHVERWAENDGSTSFSKIFQKGQTLFGKRRAYQKKIAIAEFDGICSGDILVFDSKAPNVLLASLIQFICMSDSFFKYAEANSQGSLSPRVSFSALSQYEFLLPPIDEQKSIAEILWAADEVVQKYKKAYNFVDFLQKIFIDNWIDNNRNKMAKFSDLWTSSPESGCSAPEPALDTNYFVLSLSALSRNGYVPGNFKRAIPTTAMCKAKLSKGDFLISRSNTAELVGFVGIYNEDTDNVSFPDTMMRLHLNEKKIYKQFIEAALLSAYGRKAMKTICAGTSSSMKKINRVTLGSILIPCPSLIDQEKFIQRNSFFTDTKAKTILHTDHLRSFLTCCLNHNF